MELSQTIPLLLGLAWLLPLASFAVIVLFGPRMGKSGVLSGHVATGAILTSAVLSLLALALWLEKHGVQEPQQPEHDSHGARRMSTVRRVTHVAENEPEHADEFADGPADRPRGIQPLFGSWYSLGTFGSEGASRFPPLRVEIGYYIDTLTICMFAMVGVIATCIHFYSLAYMHEELDDVTDHEVTLPDGHHLHRPGRFPRFFQYLSLFCFSMLGLVIAGNLAMVFVFWELVGICSYLLIGFYYERKSASTAANKAFIVNRVGDFGMIIGMMALWGSLGTFTFGGPDGVFALVRPASQKHHLVVPDGMVRAAARDQIAAGVAPTSTQINAWRQDGYGYGLLVIAGLGVFCGCVGKSAQFPLHVWLPDAMEGPTPVSALIHAATMVAAGVYLVGRFFPVLTPEVLLVIAYIGGITLFIAATIAITATDIKRVLAYSTVSQLGLMMLSLGIGGWLAGLYHLFTHAFFKALLFLCSGSVIHACHTNEMPRMGGLRKKMPWTAYTMLIGCLAISGVGIPGFLGLSGFYSKDAILAQAFSFADSSGHTLLLVAATAGAAITSFYMFRLWYMTFAGSPRDKHIYEHAHESPSVMYLPLVILAVFAVGVAWTMPLTPLSLENLLEQARPKGAQSAGQIWTDLTIPEEHASHEFHDQATLAATAMWVIGILLATAFYGVRSLDPEDVRVQFAKLYSFVRHKWWFDEIYAVLFVQPVLLLSRAAAGIDRRWIDWLVDRSAGWTVGVSRVDDAIDRWFVDGLVDRIANSTYSLGLALRGWQSGRLRRYVMWIVVGTVGLFVLISWFLELAVAGS